MHRSGQPEGRLDRFAIFKISHKPLDLSVLSAERVGGVPRFPKPALDRATSFGNRWAQEGKIPALPFDLNFRSRLSRVPPGVRVGSAGNVMDCAWII
jgi:hypothetical protein